MSAFIITVYPAHNKSVEAVFKKKKSENYHCVFLFIEDEIKAGALNFYINHVTA